MDPNPQKQQSSTNSFREGCRASDGLMSQGLFQQVPYNKMKAHGLVELHDMPENCKELQSRLELLSSGSNYCGGASGE